MRPQVSSGVCDGGGGVLSMAGGGAGAGILGRICEKMLGLAEFSSFKGDDESDNDEGEESEFWGKAVIL
eukprot:CAMPEP_0172508288 /NCGR_PEP_ID=MMETSP1066-20121228/210813_1 /TAXON_ID=671091 /ORGANISM="Coscinodiscus wailesii, Strain CCMP2513" /LENGTH=68 /DNA_ID=CAMNT_0013286207 /DNA_START=294 /DNA_END=500 /DNA_ORIENTATION=+